MGVNNSTDKSVGPPAISRDGHTVDIFSGGNACIEDGICVVVTERARITRFVLPTMLVVACTLRAGATEQEFGLHPKNDAGEVHPLIAVQAACKMAAQKETDFVIAEVRKLLESNPETEVVELAIDPDYKGAAGTYLVNVVLDAHGRKLTLGVIVSVPHRVENLQTTMAFID